MAKKAQKVSASAKSFATKQLAAMRERVEAGESLSGVYVALRRNAESDSPDTEHSLRMLEEAHGLLHSGASDGRSAMAWDDVIATMHDRIAASTEDEEAGEPA